VSPTIIHWDRFNHDRPAFIAWLVLYAVTPLLVPALWIYNGGWRRGAVEALDAEVPWWARVALAVVGSTLFLIGLVIFVKPSIAIEHWPWDVTPLTARFVASFTALNVGWAAAALDRRWAAIRIPCLSSLTGWVLLLGGSFVPGTTSTATARPPGSMSAVRSQSLPCSAGCC